MDWITDFITLTDGLRSPTIFRRWAAITTIAGVLQRRVWTETKTGICYPNLYVMLTGSPGSGKTLAVKEVRKLWGAVSGMFIGPDNPTKAALIRRLSTSIRAYKNGKAEPDVFSSLAVPCEEFGVLITKYDIEFLAMLSHIWDNPDTYDIPRVSVDSYVLEKPNMSIVAAVTPDALGTTFPEVAWGQGFTSRVVFIYAEKPKFDNKDIFEKRKDTALAALIPGLTSMFDIGGEAIWSPDAAEALISWLDTGMQPTPDHGRLKFYNERRIVHMFKLGMISAVSAGRGLEITLEDFSRARTWLLEAERFMPDVFRAMAQKSDLQIITDLHFYVNRLYGRLEIARRQPIKDAILWEHLAQRIPSPTIPRVMEVAERGGWFRRGPLVDGRPTWIPRPLNEINIKPT